MPLLRLIVLHTIYELIHMYYRNTSIYTNSVVICCTHKGCVQYAQVDVYTQLKRIVYIL
jgi:hypothetical protein